MPFEQADSCIVPAAEGTPSPACPLRMLDWTSLKKKGTASITHTHYPHHPARTMEHLQTSPFPRSLGARFPQYCPVQRSWAIVRRPTCPLIVPRRTHTPSTHLNTLLVNSLSLSQCYLASPSLLVSHGNFHQLEVIDAEQAQPRSPEWSGPFH